MISAWNNETADGYDLIQVREFQKLVLKHLITLGFDIQQISTLFAGAKWHIGTWQENTTALQFLPSEVIFKDNIEKLVKYDAQHRRVGFTDFAKNLLERLATERQS